MLSLGEEQRGEDVPDLIDTVDTHKRHFDEGVSILHSMVSVTLMVRQRTHVKDLFVKGGESKLVVRPK
jgi:hypothetical protein